MVGTRGRGRRWATLVAIAVVACAAALSVAAAAATRRHHGHRPTAADRAATAAYVAADLTLQQAATAAVPARLAAERSAAAAIEAECPGVLASLPSDEAPPLNSRQFGESIRRQHQLEQITSEVERALAPVAAPEEVQALSAFIASVKPLRWSDGAITHGVGELLALLETTSREERPALHVCADISAWVASGYTTLTAATSAAEAVPTSLTHIQLSQIIAPESPRLIPFEGPTQRRQLAEARTLRDGRIATLRSEGKLVAAVEHTLGLKGEEGQIGIPPQGPPAGSVVLGRGHTVAGGGFTVRFEPATGGHGCAIDVERDGSEGGFGSGRGCTLTGAGMAPSVNCNEGLLTIEAVTRPRARRVRLGLSDGSAITSPAILIPARDGGPAGLYYQVVRGPSPIPVSLTELDGRGRPVATKRLPRVVECTKHPLKFLRGGIRTLVHARVPGGPAFTIEAQRYRFLGKITLSLQVQVVSEGFSSSSGSSIFVGNTGGHPFYRRAARRIFRPEQQTGCTPAPYTIVYGILKQPRDTVLARSGAGLIALHRQHMPATLHAGGVLVWGAFAPPPTELVLRGPANQTLLSESLAEQAKGQIEECEGEREPAPSRP